MVKTCTKCREEQVLDLFPRIPTSRDGRGSWCKACASVLQKSYAKDRVKNGVYKTEEFRRKARENHSKRYAVIKSWLSNWKKENKEKIYARNYVYRAIKKGSMERLPCVKCGELKTHAHHHNGYNKENRLNVMWLCKDHHYQIHKNI